MATLLWRQRRAIGICLALQGVLLLLFSWGSQQVIPHTTHWSETTAQPLQP
tara:strand:+ start:4207 stop:4359 length:153 start_codon:yes stop_codon:yes gene_type:complete